MTLIAPPATEPASLRGRDDPASLAQRAHIPASSTGQAVSLPLLSPATLLLNQSARLSQVDGRLRDLQACQESGKVILRPVIPERQSTPQALLKATYTDIIYTQTQFDIDQLKAAGVTPALLAAMNQFVTAYIVASLKQEATSGE